MTVSSLTQPRFEPLADHALRGGAHARARFWVERKGKNLFTHGRVLLLEEIARMGSIRKAAQALGMSYRHAWVLVNSMNRLAKRPPVVLTTGGRHGGGASLTPEGHEVVRSFRRMEAELSRAILRASRHITLA